MRIFRFLHTILCFPFHLFIKHEKPLLKVKTFLFDLERSFKHFSVEEYWRKRGKFYREESAKDDTELLLQVVRTQIFDSLLDFGCGYGKYLKVLSNNFTNKKFVGVDISSTMLQNARNHLVNLNIELHKTDGLTLPFKDNSFDITLTSHVLIHNPPNKINEIIKEIKRVTRKASIHMESTVENVKAEDYYCHDYEKLFLASGGKPRLVAEFGKEGKIYVVKWNVEK